MSTPTALDRRIREGFEAVEAPIFLKREIHSQVAATDGKPPPSRSGHRAASVQSFDVFGRMPTRSRSSRLTSQQAWTVTLPTHPDLLNRIPLELIAVDARPDLGLLASKLGGYLL